MKYPNILFFRREEYSTIDNFFIINKDKLLCNINITSETDDLNKLFDPNYPILITYGDYNKYHYITNEIPSRLYKRWIHYDMDKLPEIEQFNKSVNYCFIHNVMNYKNNQISFSLFTTTYKSFDKIKRAYNSIKKQSFKDWEWVILDDTPNDLNSSISHFDFLTELFKNDNRIRLYKRVDNSGNIGNVKNEAVLLCRGKYVLEMDHDDELVENTLELAFNEFEKDEDIGFVYMNYANIYENGNQFKYGDHFSLGYAGYYCQKFNDKWLFVASSPNINNITLSNIVAIPNHPRIWRKELLIKIGNYSELLPISDDYELFIRTALSKTKIVKINELGYIQYMNDGNNNFSLIRNSEINRLCAEYIYPMYYDDICKYGFHDDNINKPIWKRENYIPKYSNEIVGDVKYKKQLIYIGFETLLSHIDNKKININNEIDYIVLDNFISSELLISYLEYYKLSNNFKCYSMKDCSEEELIKYFKLVLRNPQVPYEIILRDTYDIKPQKILDDLEIMNLNHTSDNLNSPMLILITPSIRPENLQKISETIDFSYIYKWIIVYDMKKITENPRLFSDNSKIVEMMYYDEESISGNAQRNVALDYLMSENNDNENEKLNNKYVYFLDDDNSINPDMYKLMYKLLNNEIEPNMLYTFGQKRSIDIFPYVDILKGDVIEVYKIDSAMMLIDYNLIGKIRWKKDKYNSDGIFIKECLMKNSDKWVYINKVLAYYNKN